jgi:hypothetical protein
MSTSPMFCCRLQCKDICYYSRYIQVGRDIRLALEQVCRKFWVWGKVVVLPDARVRLTLAGKFIKSLVIYKCELQNIPGGRAGA